MQYNQILLLNNQSFQKKITAIFMYIYLISLCFFEISELILEKTCCVRPYSNTP